MVRPSPDALGDEGFDFLLDLPIDEFLFESMEQQMGDEQPCTTSDETSSSSSPPAKRKRQTKIVVELRTLKDTCCALQKQLEDLQQGRVLRMAGASPSEAKWEQVARRQQASWRKTERENRELRAVLQDQAHVKDE
ncbi:hypothetical protein As57867_006430, partial [Aphanomyces stellatus]